MSHKAAKIGLTSLVLALAFGGLLYSTLGESAQYYKHVDEVMVQPEAWYDKPLQIHGYAKNVARKRDSLEYRFEMHNNGHVGPRVVYRHRARYVRERRGSRAAGDALARRLPRDGDDGQMPVEVRAGDGGRGDGRRTWHHDVLGLGWIHGVPRVVPPSCRFCYLCLRHCHLDRGGRDDVPID